MIWRYIIKLCLQNIDAVAPSTPTYRFCVRKSERGSSKHLIDIQERIKYESIYAIDVSVIHYEYMMIFKILNGYIRTHIYFIYREYMSRNSTVIIVLTSLPYVITMMNVVRNRVMRVYFYSQISYTRSVDIDTWMYC